MTIVESIDTLKKIPPECLQELAEGLASIKYGSITLHIANGQVETVETRKQVKRKRP